jgi:hypothetical protein
MMPKFSKWLPAVLIMAGLALLGSPRSAHAVLTLRVFSGPTATGSAIFTAVDGGANDADGALNQQLQLATQTVGGLLVSGSFHTSNAPFDDASGFSALTSGSSSVLNTTAATIVQTIELSDTNFGATGRTLPVFVDTTTSGTFSNTTTANPAGSSVTSTWFLDPNNALFGTTGSPVDGPVTFPALSTPTNSYSRNQVGLGPFGVVGTEGTGLFSMTERFTITLTGRSQLTSRGQNEVTRPVPEPGTMATAFAGLGTLGLGRWIRRRRRMQA